MDPGHYSHDYRASSSSQRSPSRHLQVLDRTQAHLTQEVGKHPRAPTVRLCGHPWERGPLLRSPAGPATYHLRWAHPHHPRTTPTHQCLLPTSSPARCAPHTSLRNSARGPNLHGSHRCRQGRYGRSILRPHWARLCVASTLPRRSPTPLGVRRQPFRHDHQQRPRTLRHPWPA